MKKVCFVFVVLCATIAACFDLGPLIRVAQCRMECIKKHSVDGSCSWLANREETTCNDCWRSCEALETQWESTKFICETRHWLSCPACHTACQYRRTRVETEYLPSSLPAPSKGPVKLGHHDIAIVLFRVADGWQLHSYHPGSLAPPLRPDSWIIAVLEDGVKHYSWQEWQPTLVSLKEGPLFEATVSWNDMEDQLKAQRTIEQDRMKDRVKQAFLEQYGEKVRIEFRGNQDAVIPREIFRKFFFNRSKETEVDETMMKKHEEQITIVMINDFTKTNGTKVLRKLTQPEYVISWEPEAGGLMGNQVVDTQFAQISLLPGTKYLVRIATNDGPGSYPIEIDTMPRPIHVLRVKKNSENVYVLAILAGIACAIVVLIGVICVMLCCRTKKIHDEITV